MKYIFIFLLLPSLAFSQNKGASSVGTKTAQFNSGNTYAVVVGISYYQAKAISNLRFANKNAKVYPNYLRSNAGCRLDNVHVKRHIELFE